MLTTLIFPRNNPPILHPSVNTSPSPLALVPRPSRLPSPVRPLQPPHDPRTLGFVDRLSLYHHPGLSPDDHSQQDSTLRLPLDFNYVPRAQSVHSSPRPDAVYQHHVRSRLFRTSRSTRPDPVLQHANQDYDPRSHQRPPAIHTLDLLYPSDSAEFTPSPISSLTDNRQRFSTESGLSGVPFTNPALHRCTSKPILGAGDPSYVQPPSSQHDIFAYFGTSYATVALSSPLSPLPSFSDSSYSAHAERQRDSRGASVSSPGLLDLYVNPVAQWGSGLDQADLEADVQLGHSPLSPLYPDTATSCNTSVTGLPSPPAQKHSSLSKTKPTIPPSGSVKPQHDTPSQTGAASISCSDGNSGGMRFLPGHVVKKRPRRRFDEIERFYQCRYAPIPLSI